MHGTTKIIGSNALRVLHKLKMFPKKNYLSRAIICLLMLIVSSSFFFNLSNFFS